ncbi:MAG TPA: bifunctional tetrahydrofolate synthase/dihydrofolate synthase [Thiotrichales bacterium]|nr:bifunctional tetrahydrofolate synthase/dihydrofolate synthase [Thiotrichales bacterium]
MRFTRLDDWLSWQESLNPAEIDLGLARVEQVLSQAGLSPQLNVPIITVAGTNGKGSVVAMLESIARSAGLKVCSYTSPHLFSYNERIRINGQPVDDEMLCEAFEHIDQARGDVSLTYFEFGTLAAIDIFSRADADLVILEVGLGGRLDAVNVMQPAVSVVTAIDIDHTDWLGSDRDSIAREKAGIFRNGVVAVCGDPAPPPGLYEVAADTGAQLMLIGRDYTCPTSGDGWSLQSPFGNLPGLPLPALYGEFQRGNAATAIVALQALPGIAAASVFNPAVIGQGLQRCTLPGRFQQLRRQPQVRVDVAHNPQAARALAAMLAQERRSAVAGKCYAVVAMLADKDIEQVVDIIAPQVDAWWLAGLAQVARGLDESVLLKRIQHTLSDAKLQPAPTVESACEQVMKVAGENDRVIVFGSFYTAAAAIGFYENYNG